LLEPCKMRMKLRVRGLCWRNRQCGFIALSCHFKGLWSALVLKECLDSRSVIVFRAVRAHYCGPEVICAVLEISERVLRARRGRRAKGAFRATIADRSLP
jgi:hypothetical protein